MKRESRWWVMFIHGVLFREALSLLDSIEKLLTGADGGEVAVKTRTVSELLFSLKEKGECEPEICLAIENLVKVAVSLYTNTYRLTYSNNTICAHTLVSSVCSETLDSVVEAFKRTILEEVGEYRALLTTLYREYVEEMSDCLVNKTEI